MFFPYFLAMTSPTSIYPHLKLDRQPVSITYCKEPLSQGIDLNLVQVPGGEFLMGSPADEPDRSAAEGPQHRVTVPSFFMGQYPVTQAEWRVVAGFAKVERSLNPTPSAFEGDRHPVEQVSWLEASEFCARLAYQTRRPYRLPTEAEWEYACRAGTSTPFHFGETMSTEVANYYGKKVYGRGRQGAYRKQTTPVDAFGVANRFGLCDMHGNVYEWCLDVWHSSYQGAPTDSRPWLDTTTSPTERVLRGGAWDDGPAGCRSASRSRSRPELRGNIYGLRVVVALS